MNCASSGNNRANVLNMSRDLPIEPLNANNSEALRNFIDDITNSPNTGNRLPVDFTNNDPIFASNQYVEQVSERNVYYYKNSKTSEIKISVEVSS